MTDAESLERGIYEDVALCPHSTAQHSPAWPTCFLAERERLLAPNGTKIAADKAGVAVTDRGLAWLRK